MQSHDVTRQDARLMRLHVVPSGRLAELADEVDELGRRTGAPFTSKSAWLRSTVSAVGAHESWAVIVRDQDGLLCAAVVVLERARPDHQLVTLADAHLGFRGSILASDSRAAALLGYGLRRQLQYRQRPTVGVIGPVATDTVGLADFCANLGEAEVREVSPIPLVRRGASGLAGDYLSASMRRTLRKAANRLQTDGRTARIDFTDRPDRIKALLPALLDLHVARDHDRGLASSLDADAATAVWEHRLTALADEGTLELGTLHIDDAMAAYVLSVRAIDSSNVLEGVLDPQWSRYAPGRLLETALLQRMLDDPQLTALDWTSPLAPESLLAANDATPISVVTTIAVPTAARALTAAPVPSPRVARQTTSQR